jgi:hypothetical protein
MSVAAMQAGSRHIVIVEVKAKQTNFSFQWAGKQLRWAVGKPKNALHKPANTTVTQVSALSAQQRLGTPQFTVHSNRFLPFGMDCVHKSTNRFPKCRQKLASLGGAHCYPCSTADPSPVSLPLLRLQERLEMLSSKLATETKQQTYSDSNSQCDALVRPSQPWILSALPVGCPSV